MVANLDSLLLRFRMSKTAFTADIQKAYLQLQLEPSDRNVIRFLWVKYVNNPWNKDNTQESRFCRVIWGIVCSAFLLAHTSWHHLQSYGGFVAGDIARNIYIKNLVSGSKGTDEAIELHRNEENIQRGIHEYVQMEFKQ